MINIQINTTLGDEVDEGLLQGLVSQISEHLLPLPKAFKKLETCLSSIPCRGMPLCSTRRLE